MDTIKKTTFIILMLGPLVLMAQEVVETTKGKISGYTEGNVHVFKGIPFAAPPVGELRWKAPQPAPPWEGVRECIEFGPSPMQNQPQPFYAWTEEFIALPQPLNEDCLYLNVWSPTLEEDARLPVFVWIYGGGFSSGSANVAVYDGTEMARKGVVFISLNYRVGPLGFMAHPELTAESGHEASGNYGFMDQMAALKWVQRNVMAFGGDPQNVTIAGQSAGAFSVNALMASPLAEGLFHKAVLQSGGILSSFGKQGLGEAEKAGVKLMEKAGAGSLNDLRNVPAEKIQEIANDSEIGRFGITLDDYVIPTDLMAHFEEGKHHQVPILTGWVTGDGNFLGGTETNVETYTAEAMENYGERADTFLDLFPGTTAEEIAASKSKFTLLNFAGIPAHLLAKFTDKPTYLYQFAHVPPDKPDFPNYGAFHTSEVPYTLHTLHTWNRPWQERDWELEELMSSYWVNFAKTGNPNGEGLPPWSHYTSDDRSVLLIGDTVHMENSFLKPEIDFLTSGQ